MLLMPAVAAPPPRQAPQTSIGAGLLYGDNMVAYDPQSGAWVLTHKWAPPPPSPPPPSRSNRPASPMAIAVGLIVVGFTAGILMMALALWVRNYLEDELNWTWKLGAGTKTTSRARALSLMYCDEGIAEFVENQRYWGLTWGAPLLPFDWPAFSDAHGNAVQLTRPPEREGERGWFVVRTLGTDEEGWRYSTVFSKITTPRPGGRASKRSSDYVRSRVWRKLTAQPEPPDREMQELFFSNGGGNPPSATGGAGASGGDAALPTLATSGAAGHSLGAGVAGLLTLLLRQRSQPMAAPAAVPVVHCLAIAPPAVMSRQLAEVARQSVVSVVLSGDFVARLSCYSVDRALLELVQASPAAQMADNLLQSTGATWAAIQQRLAALGSVAGGGGFGGSSGGGLGGPFAFLAGNGGSGGRGGDGSGRGGRSGSDAQRMELEMVPTCAGLKDIPLLTSVPQPGGQALAPALGPAGAGPAAAGQGHGAGPHQHQHQHRTHPHPAHSHHHIHHHRYHYQQQQHPVQHGHNHHGQTRSGPGRRGNGGASQPRSPRRAAAAPAATGDEEDEEEPVDAVSARSDGGSDIDALDEDDNVSYFTAASPHESYLSAASSPASRYGGPAGGGGLPYDETADSGFLYRATHPSEHHPATALGAAGAGAASAAAAAWPASHDILIPAHRRGAPAAVPPPGLAGPGGADTASSGAAASTVQRHPTPAGMAAAAAAAAVGGVPYAGHGYRAAGAGAGGVSAARAIPGAAARHGDPGAAAAADRRFAAMTPPATSPAEGFVHNAAATEGWGLGFFSGGMPSLGPRRSSDPLAARGPLYRQAEAEAEAGEPERPGGRSRAVAEGRRRARSRSRGASGGDSGGGDSTISWEALSHKLMTSWFGKGFFEEEGEDDDEAAAEATGGDANGGGGLGWWLAAMTGGGAAAAAAGSSAPSGAGGTATRGAGGVGSAGGLTSCWPGLEEPPGPHRHPPDAAAAALRGKYGAPTRRVGPVALARPVLAAAPVPAAAPTGASAGPAPRAAAADSGDGCGAAATTAAMAREPGGAGSGRQGGAGGAAAHGGAARTAVPVPVPAGSRPRHRASRSAPGQELPDMSDAVLSDAGAEEELLTQPNFGADRAGARGLPRLRVPDPHHSHHSHHSHSHRHGSRAAVATAPASEAATGASSGGEGGGAAAEPEPEPHYVHSVHKELYPPGRLLWIVVDELEALPPHIRGMVVRASSSASAAPKGVGGGSEGEAGGVVGTEAAPAVATANGRQGSGGERGVGMEAQRQETPTPAAAVAAPLLPKKADSFGLMDLSLVTDLVHDLVVGSRRSADGTAAGITGGGSTAAAPSAGLGHAPHAAASTDSSRQTTAPAPLEASRTRASAGGAPAAADAAAIVAAAAQCGSAGAKRPRVSFSGDAWTDLAEDTLAAAQCIGSPFRAASGSLGGGGGRTAPSSPPLGAGDSVGSSASSTPFTVRVREGLKRIKSGVETMLRQAPIPSLPSVPSVPNFLPNVSAAAAAATAAAANVSAAAAAAAAVLEDVTAPAAERAADAAVAAAEAEAEAAAGGAGGGAEAPSGPWVFLVEAEREVFERMVLLPNCFTDHLPDAYVQRLRQLAKGAVVLPQAAAATASAGREADAVAGSREGEAAAGGGDANGRSAE
ncbi:hypothetical protein GPECTOR_47g319 [Gonium pectorale]|uniref:Fungal lipase-type domain-containing protein n=1 Tax=Gonium pectorale TaxID=33097 RepID=A0A150G885_GONPE|nr:hypothetical protein GPECTOR_47g319 [Gonium pectorale]|eukprot:KXZ46044.1 hypothetical protein GPECTOR_47g319 [Gonium pectorale]